jgi:sensor histidine kinase YesM
MNLHDFIFSNNRWYRVLRHLCFWLGWFLFSGIVQVTVFSRGMPDNLSGLINTQIFRSLNRLPVIFLFCYFVVYFLVPRFTRNGRLRQIIIVFLLSGVLLYLATLIWFRYAKADPSIKNWPTFALVYFSFYSNINFTGTFPICCLMLAIKYYKNWSIKQRRSEQLGRENVQAELQLLKAQVHPHFLFNTLNNIYSFVLNKNDRAAGLVDKLSGMIDYMTTEGEKPLVLLEKEIQLVNDYIGLERVRYGERLDMQVKINGNPENKMIAPLLLIPFVENCFKHGASVMRGQQWINLKIDIKNSQLDFQLNNSKPAQTISGNKKGIGLSNVQKRLQLLYPGKYYLKTESTNDTFNVHLQIDLVEMKDAANQNILKPKMQTESYA